MLLKIGIKWNLKQCFSSNHLISQDLFVLWKTEVPFQSFREHLSNPKNNTYVSFVLLWNAVYGLRFRSLQSHLFTSWLHLTVSKEAIRCVDFGIYDRFCASTKMTVFSCFTLAFNNILTLQTKLKILCSNLSENIRNKKA